MNDSVGFPPLLNLSGKCFYHTKVYSDGMWNEKHGESLLQHPFFRFQAQLLAMYSISHFIHLLLKRCNFPRLTSDILGGFILGPNFFGKCFPHASNLLFPPFPDQMLASLLKIGLVLFTFLAALRVDITYTKRIEKKGAIVGCFLFLYSITFLQTLQVKFNPELTITLTLMTTHYNNTRNFVSSFIQSQFIDVSMTLMQLRLTNSKLGQLALSSSMINELALFVHTTYRNLMLRVANSESKKSAFQSFFLIVFFMLLIFGLMRSMLFWFIKITPEGKPIKNLYTNIFLASVLIISSIGDNMGVDYLYGPFCIGLITPAGSPLAANMTQKLDTMVYGLLVPLLSTFVASKVDLMLIVCHSEDLLKLKISLIGFLLTLAASFLLGLFFKLSRREAVSLALILSIKGIREMGVILSYISLEEADLDGASAVVLVFLLTTFTPPLILWLYDPAKHYVGYQKKCIQLSPIESELGILACAHKQGDAIAAIKLLELSNPTKQCPIEVYGLCLEELVSSFNPYIINHQLGQKVEESSKASHSQPIIDVFQYFKLEFKHSSQMSVFTAVAPIQQMHEDISWLAFDKSCSLILIPFHKRWNENGILVSNSAEHRKLNINIFNRAPCSVGLLINRRKTRGLSSIFKSVGTYNIAVLFLGGPDDREALAYAMRMARNPKVQLTVIILLADYDAPALAWEDMLDGETVRKFKEEMAATGNISFEEKPVRDGSDTASVVSSCQGKHDLIMVGRRHDTKKDLVSGLSQWAEFPELGAVGDILASSDVTAAVSVLVIQQQIMKVAHSSVLN
ncbi:cation/H(+) antiporter 15-like [Euphorbia lathyris]|uniref:cation/H(+) antiporter 15-like n=1 Tax=Euphorbia lathyris TaxID=212925 RepID=UPI003313ABA4